VSQQCKTASVPTISRKSQPSRFTPHRIHSAISYNAIAMCLGTGEHCLTLATLAEPDTICISHKVYEEVERKLPWARGPLRRLRLRTCAAQLSTPCCPEKPKGSVSTCVCKAETQAVRRPLQLRRTLVARGSSTAKDLLFPAPPALALPDTFLVCCRSVNRVKTPTGILQRRLSEVLTSDLSKLSGLFSSPQLAFTYKGKR